MTYLTEEEKCILRMYRNSDRIRTVADMIDALEVVGALPLPMLPAHGAVGP